MPGGRHQKVVKCSPASVNAQKALLVDVISELDGLDPRGLRLQWRNHLGGSAPAHLPRWLLLKVLAYRIQAAALGNLDAATLRVLRDGDGTGTAGIRPFTSRSPSTRDGTNLGPGAMLVREWKGSLERVMVLDQGFAWNGQTYGSLSQVARAITGTSWNGHRFFGLAPKDPRSFKASPRPPDSSHRPGGDFESASGLRA